MNKLFLACVIFLLFSSSYTYGQQYIKAGNFDASRMKLEKNRTNYVAKNLKMTEEFSNTFWPLYKSYRSQVKTINERTIALIKIYATNYNQDTITNEKASQLMSEFMAIDKERLMLKAKYIEIFSAQLPEKLVWRFFHIESNLDTMIKNSYISQIPMVDL